MVASILSFDASNWLSLASVLSDILAICVGGIVAFWVVDKVQARLESDKLLRDYFASEIIAMRKSYQEIVNDIYSQRLKPKNFVNKINSISAQLTDISKRLSDGYGIDNGIIDYQVELNTMVSDDPSYIKNFKRNTAVTFSEDFINRIRLFEARNCSVFNDVLEKIYGKE